MFLDFLFGKKNEGAASASPGKEAGICDEARRLSSSRAAVSHQVDGVGREAFENALLLRQEALRLASEFDELLDRKRKAEYGAVATRIKFARKAENTGKELARFAQSVISLFDEGKLREGDGKVFGKVHELLRSGKPSEAHTELSKLESLARLKDEEKKSAAAIAAFKEKISAELSGLKNSLKMIAECEEFGRVDDGAAAAYKGLQEKLREYARWRAEHIGHLKAGPFLQLPPSDELLLLGFSQPRGASLPELIEFVRSEPSLPRLSAPALLEMGGWSDARLAHSLPEVSKFRRLIRENREYLWGISELERTGFLEPGSPEQCRRICEHFARKGQQFPPVLAELAALGGEGLGKLKAEAEKLDRLEALRESAKPERKGQLLARKSELEQALSLLEIR